MDLFNETKSLLLKYRIKPKRRLGQNFCVDYDLIKRIVEFSKIDNNDKVLEIGAGLGFLTKALSNVSEKVLAFEIDHRLVNLLRDRLCNQKNVVIIEGDILKVQIPKFNKIVANLPYSISSPFILKLLKWRFDNAVFTLQYEFARKLLALKGENNYGRITVLTYYKTDIKILERVSRNAFYPQPKVDSVLVQIKLRPPSFEVINEPFFVNYINFVFTQRNKKLRNVLITFFRKKMGIKKTTAKQMIQGIHFLESRVRELSPEEFGITSNQTYQCLTSMFSGINKINCPTKNSHDQ